MRQSRQCTLLCEVIIKLSSEMISVRNRNQISQYRDLFTNTIKTHAAKSVYSTAVGYGGFVITAENRNGFKKVFICVQAFAFLNSTMCSRASI